MGCGLALPTVAWLLLGAAVEPDVSLRTDGRETRYVAAGAVTYRSAASAIPQAALAVDAAPLKLQAGYAATFWTSDVGTQPSALVNHAADARLELAPDAPWRATASANLLRGETDPLASVPTASSAGASQLASSGPIPYQSLRSTLRLERQLDPRWTLAGDGRWSDTRALRGELASLLPPQRTAGGSAGLSYRATERDTVTVRTSGDWSETDTVGGYTTGVALSADGSWRRALTPTVDGWTRAGVGWLRADEPLVATRRDLLPVAGLGLVRTAERGGVGIDLSTNLTSAVDRFKGDVRPVVDARLVFSWSPAAYVLLAAQASGARRLDGDTTLGAADLRFSWTVRPRVAVEGGALWRLQRERRPELPSFSETGVFMGLRVTSSRR
jgi:hypothetical protein